MRPLDCRLNPAMRLLAFCMTERRKALRRIAWRDNWPPAPRWSFAVLRRTVLRHPVPGAHLGFMRRVVRRVSLQSTFCRCAFSCSFGSAQHHRAQADAMIRQAAPDAIVLFEDNVEDATRFLGAAAAARDIPYIVLPTTIPNPREPANVYQHSRGRTRRVGFAARAVFAAMAGVGL